MASGAGRGNTMLVGEDLTFISMGNNAVGIVFAFFFGSEPCFILHQITGGCFGGCGNTDNVL